MTAAKAPTAWLLFIDSLASEAGGPPNAVVQTAAALAARGEHVQVLTTQLRGESRPPLMATANSSGVDVVVCRPRVRHPYLASARLFLDAYPAIRRADRVSLHGVYLLSVFQMSLLCRILRTPYSVQPHGSLEIYQDMHRRRRKILYRRVFGNYTLRHATHIFVASESERRNMHVSEAIRVKAKIGGSGIVAPQRPSRRNGTYTILYLSRLAEKKRVDLLLHAASELRKEFPRLKLIVAGSGDRKIVSELRRAGTDLETAGALRWAGQVLGDAKAELYDEASVFCLPSDNENFGQAVVEALAFGLPVVTTDAVASGQVVREAGAGLVVAHNDSGELARGIRILLANPTDSADMGSRGRHYVMAHLGWSSVAERWTAFWAEDSAQTSGL